ncbi:MAG: DctP family TRAP transporter solute-binding subunit [Giesbergeria sp.]|uniref:DctP family TRAP transporter solute-binding subunit n=1 Tax=Giesbergeria sp. TaxID=2818473 RepID=UPI002613E106|nr:DctP family TRAP transporter solute-binding subunit [Giesbergeria sp.]MDD2608584.1 DctP family TRAP transporter solute-binding subunit [Giesbergeria sp.]
MHHPNPALTRRCFSHALAVAGSWPLVCSSATAPTAHDPIVIQLSHVVGADTAKGKAALKFRELAEARTAGRVRVEVYPDSSLYKDREELQALQIGAVQMLATSLSKLATVGGSDFEVFDLPFLFKNHATFRAAVDGPVGTALLQRLEPSGLQGLAFWDNGFKVFSANRPLLSPTDFRGAKIRIQSSRVLVAQMQALGAEVSIRPMANVYEALRSGQLDGQENVPANIYSQHLHDVQSHLSVTRHGYLAYVVLVNRQFWDKLPADIRAALHLALHEATQYANSIAEAENQRALELLKASGKLAVYEPSATELLRWRQALTPVYRQAATWMSPGILRAIGAHHVGTPR